MKITIKSVEAGKWRVDIGRNTLSTYGNSQKLIVSFFDMSADKSKFPNGQFVSDYYLDTLMGRNHSQRLRDLDAFVLDFDIPAWTIYAKDLKVIDEVLEKCEKYQGKPIISEFGKIMNDFFELSQQSEEPVWFLEKEELESGMYTQEDYDEFISDVQRLNEEYGITDVYDFIEFYDDWRLAVSEVVTFYGAFENLFEEKNRVLQNTYIIITDPKEDLEVDEDLEMEK